MKYTDLPVFETMSWAVAYHVTGNERGDCNGAVRYLFDIFLGDREPDPDFEDGLWDLEFEVLEQRELDGVTYVKFLAKGREFWTS